MTRHIARRRRVLIADNDDANVQLLADICETENLEVAVARNGAQALASAREALPDVVLLDVMMPEKDGFEVLKELRSDAATAHVPIILLTAVTDDESVRLGYQLGANDYITKPFKVAELLTRMRSVVAMGIVDHVVRLGVEWDVGDESSLAAQLRRLARDEGLAPVTLLLFACTARRGLAATKQPAAEPSVLALGNLLRSRLRGIDGVHLLQGTVLTLVLTQTTAAQGQAVAERLRATVAGLSDGWLQPLAALGPALATLELGSIDEQDPVNVIWQALEALLPGRGEGESGQRR